MKQTMKQKMKQKMKRNIQKSMGLIDFSLIASTNSLVMVSSETFCVLKLNPLISSAITGSGISEASTDKATPLRSVARTCVIVAETGLIGSLLLFGFKRLFLFFNSVLVADIWVSFGAKLFPRHCVCPGSVARPPHPRQVYFRTFFLLAPSPPAAASSAFFILHCVVLDPAEFDRGFGFAACILRFGKNYSIGSGTFVRFRPGWGYTSLRRAGSWCCRETLAAHQC